MEAREKFDVGITTYTGASVRGDPLQESIVAGRYRVDQSLVRPGPADLARMEMSGWYFVATAKEGCSWFTYYRRELI